MGTNFDLLLADLFLYLYEANLDSSMDQSSAFTFPRIEDVFSFNNLLGDYVDRIFLFELMWKILHTQLGLFHTSSEIQLRLALYDNGDDFMFSIVNYPFICTNILAALADGVCTLYLSFDTIFQNLRYMSWFPWQRVMSIEEGPQSMVLSVYIWSYHLTWKTHMCHEWPEIYSVYLIFNPFASYSPGY